MKAAKKLPPAPPAPAPARAPTARPAPVPRPGPPDIALMVESIVGCKWSLHVLASVRRGVNRPGAMVRATRGLTAKVLSERLDKMIRFGILDKRSFPEVPPRVEYAFTPLGERFMEILDAIERVQQEFAARAPRR